ncbi:hypothetical protein SDC9_178321 [bioreactor metagenome]|uniref:Lipoprotein n=1 Tax=bioreactor metagenome TaxID=1076179 RepID=A0A645GWW4_9ZZZZ
MKLFRNIYLFALFFLSACTQTENCTQEKNVLMQVGFYKKTMDSTTKIYSKSALTIDSIWVMGLGTDSLLYNKETSIKSINIPLKKTIEQTDYIVRFNNTTDTISIFHTNNDRYYLSLECGCVVAHSIDEIGSTGHFIDSVSIINRDINTTNAENIQIYHF